MPIPRPTSTSSLLVLALATAALASSACGDKGGYKGSKKSAALKWLESPKTGSTEGNFLKIPSLGAQLEIPETRYVFKECAEATHSPEGPNKWVPIFRCASEGYSSGGDELAEDSGEEVAMTFYIGRKDRPVDERSVAYFENELRGKGYVINDISYNDSYHDKRGIYFKYQSVDEENNPVREVVEFLFPVNDVIFVAHMDYPFGDTRSFNTDWSAILWYFKFEMPASG